MAWNYQFTNFNGSRVMRSHGSQRNLEKIIDGLVQDCSISIVSALEILQSFGDTKVYSLSQITSLTIVYWIVYSGTDDRKHQRSASLAFVRGIHWWPVNTPHKWPVTRKMFSLDDVIMLFMLPLYVLFMHSWLLTSFYYDHICNE